MDNKLLVKKIRKMPPKPKSNQISHFSTNIPKNYVHQCDILYMPTDNHYKYILTVVDIGSRLVDAEPLRKKNPSDVLNGLLNIYNRNILSQPKNLHFDSGSEFKGQFMTYLNNNNIKTKIAVPTRHKQMAIVENRNKQIASKLFEIMQVDTLNNGKESNKWKKHLSNTIKEINDNTKISLKNKFKKDKINKPTNVNVKYFIGDKVLVKLDEPMDSHNKRLYGRFRATDFRYSPVVRIVKNVILNKYKPPLYILSDINNPKKMDNRVAYSDYELIPYNN